MRIITRFAAYMMVMILVFTMIPVPAFAGNNPFSDVKEEKYYYDAVMWALENGITEGTTTTTFSPNKTCTRAQVVTFLWRAAGAPDPISENNPFTDVAPDQYYYKAVLWCVENNITNGLSSSSFVMPRA